MILLFGGTSDSLVIMEELMAQHQEVILSVATDYGKLFSDKFAANVVKKRMDASEIVNFIKEHQVDTVIDASHPFANIVSSNAITACQETGCSYIRFERPRELYPNYVETYSTLEEVCQRVKKKPGKVYLTTGSKTLKDYVKYLSTDRIQARILPTSEVLKECEKLGLRADQIDAIKGPFTQELNVQLFKKAQCHYMVTKESGVTGGLKEKIAAAHQVGMTVLMIQRPQVHYPIEYNTVQAVIQAVINR